MPCGAACAEREQKCYKCDEKTCNVHGTLIEHYGEYVCSSCVSNFHLYCTYCGSSTKRLKHCRACMCVFRLCVDCASQLEGRCDRCDYLYCKNHTTLPSFQHCELCDTDYCDTCEITCEECSKKSCLCQANWCQKCEVWVCAEHVHTEHIHNGTPQFSPAALPGKAPAINQSEISAIEKVMALYHAGKINATDIWAHATLEKKARPVNFVSQIETLIASQNSSK